MSNPTNPHQGQANTYFVQNRSNQDEMTRLRLQDQMLTTIMGGVLAEQPDPDRFQHVLDIGCGTGGWLIEAAKTYPGMSRLLGIDISQRIVKYAESHAEEQGVSDRVQFQVMDAMRRLDFPDNAFDLINVRFGDTYLRTWDWPNFLMECQRVTRPGGVVRLTESGKSESNSPAVTRLYQLVMEAFHRSGHLFTRDTMGVADELERLLNQYGLQNVQTRPHTVEPRAGTEQGAASFEDVKRLFRTIVPFLRKWTLVPDNYDTIYQQALDDLQEPDTVARWHLLTAWGTKPGV